MTRFERPYPTTKELQKQADYLNKVPEPIYRIFVRHGIPPEVARFVKRPPLVKRYGVEQ